jgi:RNA polymerase sigma-70 factor (sigma-E family)
VRHAERDAAFTEFVLTRQTHLRRIAYAICGDWHRADDVLQTALAKLYANWSRIHQAGKEEAYARQIIVRADLDDRRRAWRRREQPGLDGHDRETRADLPVEDRSALFDALQSLPVMQRKVVVLRHWLGLSVHETAGELRIGEGTVKSHSSRALAALRAALAPAGRPAEDDR